MSETYSDFCKRIVRAIAETTPLRPLRIIHSVTGSLAVYLPGSDESAAKSVEEKLRATPELSPWLGQVESVPADSWVGKEVEQMTEDIDDALPGVAFGSAHLDKLNWFYRGGRFELPGKTPIVCFFSFKGGVGRTSTAALTALALARTGKRVAVLDFDFEAPGLASLFSADDEDYEQTEGVLEFIQPRPANAPLLKLSDHYFKVQEQALTGAGEVLVFPAARVEGAEADYLNLLSRIHLALNTSRTARIELLLQSIEKELEPDIILVDSRTGFNDIAGFLLGRYASHAVLFFFGSRQNMFGLEATLPHLAAQQIDFTLVHSPVPSVPELAEEARHEFLSRSYDAFCEHIYSPNEVPDIQDDTQPHSPLEIIWSQTAVLPNRARLKALLNGGATPYADLAGRLSRLMVAKAAIPGVPVLETSSKHQALTALAAILENTAVGDSTAEFDSPEKLKRNFFPRKQDQFIFSPRTFLVLGEKGAGKTALFAALTANGDFYKALREYCGGSEQQDLWRFVPAMKKGQGFPGKQDFRALEAAGSTVLETYWLLLLVRQIPKYDQAIPDRLRPAIENSLAALPELATDTVIGSVAMEWLQALDLDLAGRKEQVFMVYDYLDSEISTESKFRGRVVGALLALWHDLTERFRCIRAKVFLRKDIFEREVGEGVTDKVKLMNFAVTLEWSYEQLLNLVWKRWVARSEEVRQQFFGRLENAFDELHETQFGPLPKLNEEQSGMVLARLLGEKMGANNQAKPLNWVRIHLSDANGHLVPRSILTLFERSSALQIDDLGLQLNDIGESSDSAALIKSRHLDAANAKVSEIRAEDLREEYPELKSALDQLKSLVRFPKSEQEVRAALAIAVGEPSVAETMQRLQDIGVLYPYRAAGKKGEQRLHIPDLYLYGLGLERTGPGAQKAVAKRKR